MEGVQHPPPLSAVLNYSDSVDSSPRSSWDDPYPPKLRLMCSYGGHIVPRPHDKSLCYVGGDTRIVVVDRHTSLSDLSMRLSKSFLNGRPFILKYQLPNDDLDSLVSVTTEEDLENMIEEYDHRTAAENSSNSKPSRIRLFLFPFQTDSAQPIGPVGSGSAKSEEWFLNAGSGSLDGGLSESASVNCLLGLEDEAGNNNNNNNNNNHNMVSSQVKNLKQGQDVQSVTDSPMLETNSSFGSTSSSPSPPGANLPPIKVKVEDQKMMEIEERFAQFGMGQKQDEGFVTAISSAAMVAEDERSDNEGHVGYRKPSTSLLQTQSQTHTQPPQFQHKSPGAIDLCSPDSVSSDSSLSNAMSYPKSVIYQDQVQIQSATSQIPSSTVVDPKLSVTDPHGRIQMQQHVQEPGYVLQPQFDKQPQQFVHSAHLIHHTPAGHVPMPASYYPVYQQQLHPQHHHHLDQQYPVYFVPTRQAQAYNFSVQQANIAESASTIPSSQPQNLPNPSGTVPSSDAYNPMRNAPLPKSEFAAGAYGTAAATPQLVQVLSNKHQQQYVTYSQIHHHHPQSVAPNSAVPANYAYNYADPAYAQVFYAQPLAPSMPSQYQTMTAAPVMLPEVAGQLPSDSMK